jgi:hypothetical protein
MEAERKSAKNKWNDVQTERKDKNIKKHTTNKWSDVQTERKEEKSYETHNKQMERRTDKVRYI